MTANRLELALQNLASCTSRASGRVPASPKISAIANRPLSWVPEPSAEQLEHSSLELARWLSKKGGLPSQRAWLDAPLLIGSGTTSFLDSPRFRSELERQTGTEARPLILLRLIEAYFDAELSTAERLGSLIRQNVSRHSETSAWDRPAQLGLFDASNMPKALARLAIVNGGSLQEAVRQIRSAGDGDRSGPLVVSMIPKVPAAAAQLLERGAINADEFLVLTEDVLVLGQHEADAFYAELLNTLATSTAGSLGAARQIRIAAHRLLADRADSNGHQSLLTAATHRRLFSWDPRRVIEVCFDLTADLDKLSDWKRKFWLGMAEDGVVEEATLIAAGPIMERVHLDPAFKEVRKLIPSAGSHIYATAILLMKVGDLTVAEWAPSGSCRVWRPGNKRAPKLALEHYDVWAIREGADHEQAHRGSAKGVWQSELMGVFRTLGLYSEGGA